MAAQQPHARVLRSDGKYINLVLKTGHLFVCRGCCCGHVERGHAPVPEALYHSEWERRKLRHRIHLTIGGCLGPCPLANVVMLNFAGNALWFQSMNAEWQVMAIYDYIEAMLAANDLLPVPELLRPFTFNFYAWQTAQSPPAEATQIHDAQVVAPIIVLSHADTDLLIVERAREHLPADFPAIYAHPLEPLRDADAWQRFARDALRDAQLILARVIGGLENAPQLRQLADFCREADRVLIAVSAIQPDPQLDALSSEPAIAREVYAYFQEGGPENVAQMLRFLCDHYFATDYGFEPPKAQPKWGFYYPQLGGLTDLQQWRTQIAQDQPTIGVMFYRAHWLSGNLKFVDELVTALEKRGACALPFFVSDRNDLEQVIAALDLGGTQPLDALITTTSFTLAPSVVERVRFPLLQAIASNGTREHWQAASRGLGPLDTAINVVLPEFDGRVITVPLSFKRELRYEPDPERADRLARLAIGYARLRRKPNAEKRIAFVLTNSNAKAGKIGNAVGLDGPASLMHILRAMQARGYEVRDLPDSPDELMHALIARGSYDKDFLADFQRQQLHGVPLTRYCSWHAELTALQRAHMDGRWGGPPGPAYVYDGAVRFPGLELGNVLVALQPPRGYGDDPDAIYHAPDLPPTYQYHAFYRWLTTQREQGGWGADAIVHMGTHGTLEWLPGKGVGPSADCFPDTLIGDVPFFYPYIISNSGEAAQAKRRTHAVMIGHLMPPQTTAELYGDLAELAQLVTEYYACEATSPDKLPLLQSQIWSLIRRAKLDSEIADILTRQNAKHAHNWDPTLTPEGIPVRIVELSGKEFAHMLEDVNGYLCELQGRQIHYGLHTLGQLPDEEALLNTLYALLRLPNLDVPSLRQALIDAVMSARRESGRLLSQLEAEREADALGITLLRALAQANFDPAQVAAIAHAHLPTGPSCDAAVRALRYACEHLMPALARTTDEITNLLDALEGRPVPPGPSGAPTRGAAHILPSGRNIYTIDPRAIPSPTAWEVGWQLAEALIALYREREGAYPQRIGLSVWGTTAIRTQGDDIAQVLALLGVRPVWQRENRRVIGVEVIPLAELGRPRIDVLPRITGLFRDALPHVVALMDEAIQCVISLDEPLDQNYPRKLYLERLAALIRAGVAPAEAERRARYRIFGCKPGTYGAGILPLIEAGNWQDAQDFARAYIAWGGYAYTRDAEGIAALDDFSAALAATDVAAKNQDNREHDIFNYDDYLQYHGGMIAAIRALRGKPPLAAFGDSSNPAKAQVRTLKSEAMRVFRTRVVNPKWLRSMMRHGYKGGLEMAATVDYLFGYDATADILEDWMYTELAERYALDAESQAFLRRSNPWALREIVQRLLEAIARGMWQAGEEMRQRLLDLLADLSSDLEDFMERAWLAQKHPMR